MRLVATVLVWAAVMVVASACTPSAPEERPIIVGVGTTVEQQVLAALTVEALERAGMSAVVTPAGSDTVDLRDAAMAGRIDLYWDYTGAAWALGLGRPLGGDLADAEESHAVVREADEENGLSWLEPTRADATLALFVRASDAPEPPAANLSWLAGVLSSGDAPLCADADFLDRPAGYSALAREYSIAAERVDTVPADEERAVELVAAGRCFAGLATATSGAAAAAGLVATVDDQDLFPPFVVSPVARAEVLAIHPRLADALAPVTSKLTTEALAGLNAAVVAGADPYELAAGYLGAG